MNSDGSLSVEEIKKINIEMLSKIDKFCADNSITYFIYYGTLIGAIRHNGFIPWDDDIDILMPRESYNRFIRMFKDDSCYVGHCMVSPNYPCSYAKVIDKSTISMVNYADYNYDMGISIDIFPLDKAPDNNDEFNKTIKRILNLRKRRKIVAFSFKSDLPVYKKIIIKILQITVYRNDTVNSIARTIEEESLRYNKSHTNYVCSFHTPYGAKEKNDLDKFKDLTRHDFESIKVNIPTQYDYLLRKIYGDYLTPPPKSERISRHGNNVYYIEK